MGLPEGRRVAAVFKELMLRARLVKMSDCLWPLLLIAVYVILMRWVLPTFGVST